MKVFAVAPLLGLAFSLTLLPFTLGEGDRYKMQIEENGTRFSEEIDIDEKKDVEVFRIPAHNNVDGADFYHDFKMRVTVTRIVSRKVCYISEMESSLSSPAKMKEDLERAASQPGKLPVTTKPYLVMVTGPANRLVLTPEILDFCGALPIYNTELIPYNSAGNDPGNRNTTITTVRQKRQNEIRKFLICNYINQMAYVENCMDKHWNLQCKIKGGTCYYMVTCTPIPALRKYMCKQTHIPFSLPQCCDYVCP